MFKKSLSILTIMVLCVSIVLAGCTKTEAPNDENPDLSQEVESTEKYSWKIGIADASDYYMTRLTKEWADMLNEKTGGRVECQVFDNCQLGSALDMLQGLEMGTIDIYEDGSSIATSANKIFDAWSMPYLYDDAEHKYNFWDKYFDEISDLVAEESNIRIVGVIDGLDRQLSLRKPIESFEDLKGLKIRVPEVPAFIKIWQSFGAAPTPMAFNEVYTSLQTGVVDGQENDIVLTYDMKFFEVVPNLVITNHVAYEGFIMFNEKTYKELPDDIKEAIKECSEYIYKKSKEVIGQEEQETMEKIKEDGVKIIEPDLAKFKEAILPMYDNYPHIKPILEYVEKARN